MLNANKVMLLRVVAYLISTFFIYKQIDESEELNTETGVMLLLFSSVVLAVVFITVLKDDKSAQAASLEISLI